MAIESFTQPSRFDELIIGTQIPCTPGASQVVSPHPLCSWLSICSLVPRLSSQKTEEGESLVTLVGKVIDFQYLDLAIPIRLQNETKFTHDNLSSQQKPVKSQRRTDHTSKVCDKQFFDVQCGKGAGPKSPRLKFTVVGLARSPYFTGS